MSMHGRELNIVKCSCGGLVEEVTTTDDEECTYGCGRHRGCCVTAFACSACKIRWTFSLQAPDMDYRD